MKERITINIPPDRNGRAPIFIEAKLIKSLNNIRNSLFEFEVDSVQPHDAIIPKTSEATIGSLVITFSSTERSFRSWRIKQNGDNIILKTYTNPGSMTTDMYF